MFLFFANQPSLRRYIPVQVHWREAKLNASRWRVRYGSRRQHVLRCADYPERLRDPGSTERVAQ